MKFLTKPIRAIGFPLRLRLHYKPTPVGDVKCQTSMKLVYGYIYTVIFALILVAGISGLFEQLAIAAGTEEPTYVKILGPSVAIAMFGFWFLMLGDFFSNKGTKHPVLVGFSLIFLNWFAILVYFWFVVRPRETLNK